MKPQSKRIFLTIASFVILCTLSYLFFTHIFFTHFEDEADNFLVGKFFLDGYILFKDIYLQHQPLTYIISGIIQFITQPENIYRLVQYFRGGMIIWSIALGVFFTWRFGIYLMIPVIIYELTKMYLLGNLFLAESLIVYPFIYITALFFEKKKELSRFDMIGASLCITFIFYNLTPLWPAIALIGLLLITKTSQKKWFFLSGSVIFIIVSLMIFSLTSFSKYIEYVIVDNFRYYIPNTKDFSGSISPIYSFLSPLISLAEPRQSDLLSVIRIASFGVLFGWGYLIFKKKYKIALFSFLILGLANARYVEPHQIIYGAFHMTAWYGTLLYFASLFSLQIYKDQKSRLRFAPIAFLGIFIIVSIIQSTHILLRAGDRTTDFFINYSPHQDIIAATSIIKRDGDTLFATPVANLVYWGSDLNPVNNFFCFYKWKYDTPYLKQAQKDISRTPPIFFICEDCSKSPFFPYIKNYSLLYKSKKPTKLYVNKDRIAKLTDKQKKDLAFYDMTFEPPH